jgi:hypothetical protein
MRPALRCRTRTTKREWELLWILPLPIVLLLNQTIYLLQMATEIAAVAQILQKKKRKEIRKGCTYSKEELAVLLPYKEQYRSKTSHDDRDKLLRSSILVDIFNHWLSNGVDLTEVEVRKREKVGQFHLLFLPIICIII